MSRKITLFYLLGTENTFFLGDDDISNIEGTRNSLTWMITRDTSKTLTAYFDMRIPHYFLHQDEPPSFLYAGLYPLFPCNRRNMHRFLRFG